MSKVDEKNKEEILKIRGEYEEKIKRLEDRLAQEIRKMEDSNGYLKKMYEEKINNYEK